MKQGLLRSAAPIIGVSLLGFFAAGCTRTVDATAPRPTVRLATASPDLMAFYSKALPDITFSVTAAGTAQSHLEALQRGAADVGAAMADVTYSAYIGSTDERDAFDRLRGMVVLQPRKFHLVVRHGLNLTSVGGLRGYRVAVGPPESEMSLTATMLLSSFGLSGSHVRTVSMPNVVALEGLQKGTLDAAFISGGDPLDFVETAMRSGAYLLDVQGPPVERLRSEYPFLRNALIPANTYAPQNKPIYTVSVDTVLLCRADLDEVLAYRLTKALVEALPFLSSKGTYFQNIDVKRIATTPIPLHQGAARYYRERELFQ